MVSQRATVSCFPQIFVAALAITLYLSPRPCLDTARAQSADPQGAPRASNGADERLAERDRLAQEATRLLQERKIIDAIAPLEKALAIERELLAELRSAGQKEAARRMEIDLVGSLVLLAELYEYRELPKKTADFRPAEEALEEALQRLVQLFPPGDPQHYRVTNARLALEDVRRLAALPHEDRLRLRQATQLNDKAVKLWRAGQSRQGLALMQQAVDIRKKILGEHHPDYAISLSNLGILYMEMGEYAEAERLLRQALDIFKRNLGEEHPDYATSLNNLGLLYWRMGNYPQAEPLLRQGLEITRKTLGEEHPDYAGSVNNLATLYRQMGDYARAEPLFRKTLEIAKKLYGEDHPDYPRYLNNLAALYWEMGDYARAEPLYQKALELRKKIYGEDHPAYATSLNNLGLLYSRMGKYAQAERLLRQTLDILRRTIGEEHPDYASALNNLGSLYRDWGDYARAEPIFREAVEISRRRLGKAHPDYANSLSNLGLLYLQMGNYARAEALYREALQISRKVYGEEHPEYARNLSSLSVVYREMGDYDRAEPLLRQALQIQRKLFGEEHLEYATTLSSMAGLYTEMGDYTRAERLLQQAVNISKRTFGEEHPDYAHNLAGLALVYSRMGDLARAERLLRKALEIYRKAVGEEHPEYATVLNHLGIVYLAMGDHRKAEALCRQAIRIREKIHGEEHPHYASTLNNLASIYVAMGDYDRAEPLLRKALDLSGKTLGEEHPHYANVLGMLGTLCAAQGRAHEAERLLRRSLAVSEELRDRVFAIQSQRQRLRWTAITRDHLDDWLDAARQAGVDAGTTHSAVLRWKGAVLQRQREDQIAARHPELKPLVEELNSVRNRWATLALAVPEPAKRPVWERQLRELAERKEDLESELARRSAAFRQDRRLAELTSQELSEQLPPDLVFVDFLVYSPLKAKHEKGKARREQRLVAFVLRRGQEPVRLEVGPVAPIADAIESWRRKFGTDPDGQKAARELYRRLLQPLRTYLSGAKILIVAPDGPLCRFPLAALPGRQPGSYLIEELAVGYVSSGRHLAELLALRAGEKQTKPHASGLLLAGGVEYDAPSGQESTPEDPLLVAAPGRTRGPVGLEERLRSGFGFLPGTLVEAERIAALFSSIAPAQPRLLLTGAQATERRMKEELARGWRYVHLATHGFFAPPEKLSAWRAGLEIEEDGFSPTSRQVGRLYSPLLLSGLVLAGVKGGGAGEDGVLTAEEVAALDLEGTDLVVLSACDTGLGEVAGGEGVLGLQRAFHVAGARTVVSSLWRVNDAATSLLMEEFYRNLWQGEIGPLEAMRQAQLFVLRHPERVEQRAEELAVRLAERGLKFQAGSPLHTGERSHPGLWAGFFLSGKWWAEKASTAPNGLSEPSEPARQ